ncbi:MAG: CaiB/BaiF CoA-transferase family protein [Pseudomonadota bacterium]
MATRDSSASSRQDEANTGPLAGLTVLDMSRILAGPTCTQLLGDLGADIIKVERPGAGDDTRKWGPPFVTDADGQETSESAYYLCANRNKRSVSIDVSKPEGAELVRLLAAKSDVFIENFKVGGLEKFGLSYASLKEINPRLIYCSITGFGQTGPYAHRAGYDFLIQGMGGIMSITGDGDGEPMKVGVGIADVMCGMYASSAILAALRERDLSGLGQHIDLSLLDSQVAWLINAGLNYLTGGERPARLGNNHPNIVPYQTFPASDGHFILAVGNDAQFARFCDLAELSHLASDDRFKTNEARVRNRSDLSQIISDATSQRPRSFWLSGLEARGVPGGPINAIDEVFDDPQIRHREMKISMHHEGAGRPVDLIGNPIRYSRTPVSYRRSPPQAGQDTEAVLSEILGVEGEPLDALRTSGVIGS